MNLNRGSTPQPFQVGVVVSLQDGEASQQPTLVTAPADKWLVMEYTGVNAFVQLGQRCVIALEVRPGAHPGTYLIVLLRSFTIEDPERPVRSFGSQFVRLYAAPKGAVMLPIRRSNAQGAARIFVDISGILLDAQQPTGTEADALLDPSYPLPCSRAPQP